MTNKATNNVAEGEPAMDREHPSNPRDPEDRATAENKKAEEHKEEVREKMMDKTLADSFPTSDPPSSIPDPEEDPYAA